MQAADLAAPALHLVATTDGPVFSKVGGLPNLSSNIDWPSWKGNPLAFLCQISILELPADATLRRSLSGGYLYFFYDQEQTTWGFDPADVGSWRVIYSLTPPPSDVREAPRGIDKDYVYTEKPVRFKPILSFPDPQRLGAAVTEDDSGEQFFDSLVDQKRSVFAGQPHHQIGGYPDVAQNDSMELECQLASNGLYCGDSSGYEDPRASALESGASEWRLLLQLDSDDDVGVMWGDCGLIYFWIRESDLASRAFDKCWMILQCS